MDRGHCCFVLAEGHLGSRLALTHPQHFAIAVLWAERKIVTNVCSLPSTLIRARRRLLCTNIGPWRAHHRLTTVLLSFRRLAIKRCCCIPSLRFSYESQREEVIITRCWECVAGSRFLCTCVTFWSSSSAFYKLAIIRLACSSFLPTSSNIEVRLVWLENTTDRGLFRTPFGEFEQGRHAVRKDPNMDRFLVVASSLLASDLSSMDLNRFRAYSSNL